MARKGKNSKNKKEKNFKNSHRQRKKFKNPFKSPKIRKIRTYLTRAEKSSGKVQWTEHHRLPCCQGGKRLDEDGKLNVVIIDDLSHKRYNQLVQSAAVFAEIPQKDVRLVYTQHIVDVLNEFYPIFQRISKGVHSFTELEFLFGETRNGQRNLNPEEYVTGRLYDPFKRLICEADSPLIKLKSMSLVAYQFTHNWFPRKTPVFVENGKFVVKPH